MKKKLKIDPWIVCTAVAVYLLPVGLVIAAILTWWEAARKIRKNKVILYCGIFTLIFSATMTAYTTLMPTDADTHIMALIFAPPMIYGVYALCLYGVLARRANAVSQLHLLVQQEHITSIHQLCQITGFSQKRTLRLLGQMIRLGILDGAWIDDETMTVRFRKSIWARQRFVCADCGAVLVVDLGHTLTCDFCGSALSHE